MEKILQPDDKRLVALPIVHRDLWDMYKKCVETMWVAEELDFETDRTDWNKLNDKEQYFIKNVLAFFAASDGIVNENLCARFANEIQLYEARSFYHFQMAMEDIHSETYALLIDTLVKDPKEKEHLFNGAKTIPAVKKKAEWAQKWITSTESFATRIAAFAAVEGIFFSGSFCAIFWLKKRGLMPGLCTSNEFISRDEGMHTDFAVKIYKDYLEEKLPENEIHAMFKEALDIEKEFICESLPVSLIGMNSELMSQYLEFTADLLIRDLGYKPLYGTKNPFEWMELLSLEGKTNFFEKKVSEYKKPGVGVEASENIFALDADF
jgi:ribonucleotide reductase beta subunit family protein with ferritin-like domain